MRPAHRAPALAEALALSITLVAVAALACLAGSAAAEATIFQSCDVPADPVELRIAGCHKPPCKIFKGQTASMEVDFEVAEDVDKFEVSAVADAFGQKVPYAVTPSNGCRSLTNAECPLDKGELVTYRLSLPIKSSYPEILLPIQVSLAAGETTLACFSVSVSIVDPV